MEDSEKEYNKIFTIEELHMFKENAEKIFKEEGFKDFRIDLSGDNYINSQISHAINEGYQRIKDSKDKSSMGLLNASFVHLALVHTLSILASNGIDEHINKRWFKVLVQVFSGRNIDIKKELQEMSNNVDVIKIYDYTQKFMNNYLKLLVNIIN